MSENDIEMFHQAIATEDVPNRLTQTRGCPQGEEEACGICTEAMINNHATYMHVDCGNCFHSSCLDEWIRNFWEDYGHDADQEDVYDSGYESDYDESDGYDESGYDDASDSGAMMKMWTMKNMMSTATIAKTASVTRTIMFRAMAIAAIPRR